MHRISLGQCSATLPTAYTRAKDPIVYDHCDPKAMNPTHWCTESALGSAQRRFRLHIDVQGPNRVRPPWPKVGWNTVLVHRISLGQCSATLPTAYTHAKGQIVHYYGCPKAMNPTHWCTESALGSAQRRFRLHIDVQSPNRASPPWTKGGGGEHRTGAQNQPWAVLNDAFDCI